MSDLLFFRLEKLCPPDGSKVRFAKIKTLMQQSICASKIANNDAQKAEAAKIEAPWCAFYTMNKNTGASQADRLRGLLPPELKSRPRVPLHLPRRAHT